MSKAKTTTTKKTTTKKATAKKEVKKQPTIKQTDKKKEVETAEENIPFNFTIKGSKEGDVSFSVVGAPQDILNNLIKLYGRGLAVAESGKDIPDEAVAIVHGYHILDAFIKGATSLKEKYLAKKEETKEDE